MRWQDEGIIISIRQYGDSNLIISAFTKNHGKRKGFTTKTKSHQLQIGDYIHIKWSAKSNDSLGYFKCEIISSSIYHYFYDNIKTMLLATITSILEKVLPENEKQIAIYQTFLDFIDCITQDCPVTHSVKNKKIWQKKYLNLELKLLSELGFALDLSKCAVYNTSENLNFISPKTGRAVSKSAGLNYIKKLLPLPKLLHDIYNNNYNNCHSNEELVLSLKVLGYFLEKHLFLNFNLDIPNYRQILLSQLQ